MIQGQLVLVLHGNGIEYKYYSKLSPSCARNHAHQLHQSQENSVEEIKPIISLCFWGNDIAHFTVTMLSH